MAEKHKSKPLTGKTFREVLVEKALEQGARKDYPQQPFLFGYEVISCLGSPVRYAQQMPLKENEKALVERFTGRPWNPPRYLRRLKSLLVQRCNVQNPDGLVWDDILTHITVYLQEQQRVVHQPTEGGDRGPTGNTHSDDFTSVCWNDKQYHFNKTQAQCIKLLWNNETLGEKIIAEKIGSGAENFRLFHVFRKRRGKGMNVAWGEMVVKCGKGIFGLNRPAQ